LATFLTYKFWTNYHQKAIDTYKFYLIVRSCILHKVYIVKP
jgi:hypothetical protein